jgi:hypothetical protein
MSLLHYKPGGGTSMVGSSKGATAAGPVGLTGATGPTGPAGPNTIPSAYATLNGGTITLTTSYVPLLTTTITTDVSSYLLGHCTVQVANTNNAVHLVQFYMEVNGSVSNITQERIPARISASVFNFTNLTIIHRSGIEPASTYSITLFGKADTGTGMVVDHIDLSGLGNLS